jgi:CDP-paratose 2-epimerase
LNLGLCAAICHSKLDLSMKLLITGICGFAGSTIAKTLRESYSDIDIVGIDNLSRAGAWLNREKLIGLGVRVHHGDVRCESDLAPIGSVDWVIDAAANPSVMAGVDGVASSRQLVEHNLIGTINLLEFCKRHGAGFILLSTSRVYSLEPLAALAVEPRDNAFVPVNGIALAGFSSTGIAESFSTAPPVSLYGATKVASEALALEYGSAFGFPVWINRCGVLAGAGQFGKPDQGIFAFWLHSWFEKRPLRYIGFGGQGYQVRDCLHPRDLVPLLVKQMSHGSSEPISVHEGVSPRVYNVSGGARSARSLAQISEWCAKRMSSRPIESSQVIRPFDLPWVVLDSRRAERDWNWLPVTQADQILSEIAEFAHMNPCWLTMTGDAS